MGKGAIHVVTPTPNTVKCTNCGTETSKVARFKAQPYTYFDRYGGFSGSYNQCREIIPDCDLCIECLTIGIERLR